MKTSTLVVLSVAALAGMSSLANATPSGINDVAQGIGNTQSQLAQGGTGGSNVAQGAQYIGPNVSQYAQNGLTTNTLQQTVPEPGSLLLLGIGLLAVAIWQRRLLAKWVA